MSALDYLPQELSEPEELVSAIRARRGGTLMNLDRMLLHSPAFARGWNTFMGAVRRELSVSPRLAELAICVVAVLNEAAYEFHHHAPEFLKAGGREAQLELIKSPTIAVRHAEFDATEQLVIALTIAMTRDIKVPDTLLVTLKSQLGGEQPLIEIIGTIAAYNMVSRFLVATGVTPET